MSFDELTRDDLIEVELFLGINLIDTFEAISSFLDNEAPRIRSFFAGTTDTIVARQFKNLDKLVDRVQRTINDLSSNRDDLNLYKHWVILEDLEDSLTSLRTLQNYSLWSRSNKNINVYAGGVEIEYIQLQEETLENIEQKFGSTDPNNTWYNTAIRNSLKEEDYTAEGGTPIKITLSNTPTAFLESVVAQIDTGLKSFGIDIHRKLKFEDDDLIILDNKETLLQSANILLNLRKGDNPALPNLGVDQVSILGRSKGSFLFPIIFRQIIEIFSTDDTFNTVQFGKIKFDQDAVYIEVTVSSRYKETVESLVAL